MLELDHIERREKLEHHRHKIKSFHKEIEKTFDRNLEEKLINFIDGQDLDSNSEITYYLRKYNEFLKAR